MHDRAMQALFALTLDPVAEATGDRTSFGFRRHRSCNDAGQYLFLRRLSQKEDATWILEGDIKGCFDHINHEWLLTHIPMDNRILRQFLKAGYVYQRKRFPTDDGTPQGGIISPILANMTLDGIEELLKRRFWIQTPGRSSRPVNPQKIFFVRYADDYVVTADTAEAAAQVREVIRDFLRTRGLELSEEKTLLTHIDTGFDFLGWNFRKYRGKLLIKPAKDSGRKITQKIRDTIRKYRGQSQDALIGALNPIIRGWCNYHSTVVARKTTVLRGKEAVKSPSYPTMPRSWIQFNIPGADLPVLPYKSR